MKPDGSAKTSRQAVNITIALEQRNCRIRDKGNAFSHHIRDIAANINLQAITIGHGNPTAAIIDGAVVPTVT